MYDDVIKWEHFPRYWPFERGIHRSSVNSPHECQLRGTLIFSLICAWINGRVNNTEAGDLRRRRALYDVTLMVVMYLPTFASVVSLPNELCYSISNENTFCKISSSLEALVFVSWPFLTTFFMAASVQVKKQWQIWVNKSMESTENWWYDHSKAKYNNALLIFYGKNGIIINGDMPVLAHCRVIC